MNSAPIIFLDIDGVLNTEKGKLYWRKKPADKDYEFKADFCPHAIRNLNQLLQESGAKIVISSYWRAFFSLESLRLIFKQYEISGEIIGIIPLGEEFAVKPDRGSLISLWMKQNYEPNSYVIIDDNDSGISPLFPEYFVHVDDKEGLADHAKLEEAKKLICS